MAALTVLRDVNETIKQLLKNRIPELSDENAIIFDSPGDIEQVTTPKLSVFLYKISENGYLRNTEPEPVNLNLMRYPPLTLDLSYLLTPYAANRDTELILIESIMQTLYDNPVFSGDMLQGNLAAASNDKIRITPYGLSLDDLNKLWSTFPNKTYKLSLSYIVTPVRVPSGRPDRGITRVVERDVGVYVMEREGDKETP